MTRDAQTRRTLRLTAICALLFITFALVAAASPTLAAPVRGEGGLFLFAPDKTGKRRPAPAVASKVEIRISGAIGRTTVRQEFVNPDDAWVEGVYVFPLPDEAAVDHLKMWIGDRVIEGRIDERRAAKRRYDQAARAGRGASLLEQERANIFTMSIPISRPRAGSRSRSPSANR